jgi:hypothetical protein
MKTRLVLTLALIGLLTNVIAQKNPNWTKWNWIIGEWNGEGSGQPGQGGGTFNFAFDLDHKIIVRKSHSEYPSSDNKPAIVHNDLMVIYPDSTGIPSKAIYFDNEGHTINYSLTYHDFSIVFLSDRSNNEPIFRLTYTMRDIATANTKFEISQDGKNFTTYIEGMSQKVKPK